jgi:hypothetical protein
MQMNHAPHLWRATLGAMHGVIDGKKVVRRQFIHPFDDQALTALGVEHDAGNRIAVGP